MASSLSIVATSSKAGNAWPALLSGAVETALSSYLALDPDSPKLIAPLQGKTIALQLEPFAWTLYLCPSASSIQILHEWLGPIDVSFRGSPTAFARLRLSDNPRSELFAGGVNVTGDMDVARNFQHLFERLDIDWEEHVSQITGDLVAHRLSNLFKIGRDWLKTSHHTLRQNTAEYFQEETRDLPTAVEIEIFYDDIDRIRADVDRLDARISRLNLLLMD